MVWKLWLEVMRFRRKGNIAVAVQGGTLRRMFNRNEGPSELQRRRTAFDPNRRSGNSLVQGSASRLKPKGPKGASAKENYNATMRGPDEESLWQQAQGEGWSGGMYEASRVCTTQCSAVRVYRIDTKSRRAKRRLQGCSDGQQGNWDTNWREGRHHGIRDRGTSCSALQLLMCGRRKQLRHSHFYR